MTEAVTGVESRRIAMLIDGDNAQPSLLREMLAEVGKYGLVAIRRIYGDWSRPNMKTWKEILNVNAILPMHQFSYIKGKNATDIALIIDAMDILYAGTVSGFCLVSSDSDYTRLATRIREKGFFVMGIGQKSTPKAFVNACDEFVYTENLGTETATSQIAQPSKDIGPSPPDPLPLLRSAFDRSAQKDGWAFLGTVGGRLRQLYPEFDPKKYGHKQLAQLFRSYSGEFEMREVKSQGGPSHIYISLRDTSAPRR